MTTLFAALSMLDGKVIGECMSRHRSEDFLRFLRRIERETPTDLALHLIVDNSSTHKSPPVKRWLARHKRFHFHFTPTSSSWLNMVERWFGEISQKRIRRGSFESVSQLRLSSNPPQASPPPERSAGRFFIDWRHPLCYRSRGRGRCRYSESMIRARAFSAASGPTSFLSQTIQHA
jgi:transposase